VVTRAVPEEGRGRRARISRTATLAGVLALLAAALPGVAGAAGSCPNEEVRAEQGAGRLPDCRAFELVTPERKGDISSVGGSTGNPYAFPDGDHVSYPSLLPLPGAQSSEDASYLSTRTAAGWINTALTPPAGPGEPIGIHGPGCKCYVGQAAFTGDFSAAFVNSPYDTAPLDQDGVLDAYRIDVSTGAWSLAGLPDSGPMTTSFNGANPGTFVAGVSEDGSHVFFETFDQLPVAPGTNSEPHPGGDMLYDRTGGHTYAVGLLPDGKISETCSVEAGDGPADLNTQGQLIYGAISPDGTNVVFTMFPSERCLNPGVYLRENNATTVQLDGEFYARRSADGSKIITIGNEVGVYEYDIASGTRITITTEGKFVAASADGSRVYYLIGERTEGPLTASRLYVWDNGTSTLIPNAGEGFASPVTKRGASNAPFGNALDQAVATPDGTKLLFLDRASLTGYNTFGPKCVSKQPGLCAEAYVFDASTGSFTCVSCSPTSAPAVGDAELMAVGQPNALLPGYSAGEISPDGLRVFFETPDALVPQDTNGLKDVYEWENGRIYLLSSGQGAYGSNFAGASSDGDDVFFTTTDRLVPQDSESATQIYDARVDGGFPYRPFITGCDSGQCQGPQTPAPVFGAAPSATFVGLGNPGSQEPDLSPVKPKLLTSAQKLAKALKACRTKHTRHERRACEKQARKRYGYRSPPTRRPKS
jgi:hypothetical protein